MKNIRTYRTPNWFKEIENITLINPNGNRCIKQSLISNNFCDKSLSINQRPLLNTGDWIVVFDVNLNIPILAKIIQIMETTDEVKVEHWIVNYTLTTNINIIIEKHSTCCLNNNISSVDNCINIYHIKDCYVINEELIEEFDGYGHQFYIKKSLKNIFSIAWYIWHKIEN